MSPRPAEALRALVRDALAKGCLTPEAWPRVAARLTDDLLAPVVEDYREDLRAADTAETDDWGRARRDMAVLAVLLYRVQRALHLGRASEREVLAPLAQAARTLTGAEIYYTAEIGPAFVLGHGLGTVVGGGCVLGRRVTLFQGVTVGRRYHSPQRPVLEDEVIVYANASVLGPVRVGRAARIGAGAVVLEDVPAGAAVAGVPARVARPGS